MGEVYGVDAFPFLIVSVLFFWMAQITAWALWYFTRPAEPPVGVNKVKSNQYMEEKDNVQKTNTAAVRAKNDR